MLQTLTTFCFLIAALAYTPGSDLTHIPLCSVCTNCGHVEKGVLQNDTTFTKGPGGEATAVGQHVSDQAGTRGGGRIANGRLINYQVCASPSARGV